MSVISTTPEQDDQPTLLVFLRDVFWGLAGLMTGGVIGFAFLIWALFGTVPAVVVGGVAVVAMFVACYTVWRAERLKRFSIEKELQLKSEQLFSNQTAINRLTKELLEAKEKHTPTLEAIIAEVSNAEIVDKGEKKVAVTLKIVVSNVGAMPSAAINWTPFVIVSGRNPRLCHILHFGEQLTLGYDGGVKDVIKSQDLIYEKTVNPIQPGAIVVGYLHFRTSIPINEVRSPDTVIKVYFNDVKGKECEAIFEKNRSTPLQSPGYTPGVLTKRVVGKEKKGDSRKKN
jgi:hypothetical protein